MAIGRDRVAELGAPQSVERIRWLILTKTVDEWLVIFDREGAPVSRVKLGEHLAHDPQVVAMGYMVELDHDPQMRHRPTGSPRPAAPLGATATRCSRRSG